MRNPNMPGEQISHLLCFVVVNTRLPLVLSVRVTFGLASTRNRDRPAGTPIRGFGGVSQGSAPLVQLMADVRASLDPLIGQPLTVTAIVDIMNKVKLADRADFREKNIVFFQGARMHECSHSAGQCAQYAR